MTRPRPLPPFNFFAVLDDREPRRIRLKQATTAELSADFLAQYKAFYPEAATSTDYVPFYRPDEDDEERELLRLGNFELGGLEEVITNQESVPDLTGADIERVRAIVAGTLSANRDKSTLLFQSFASNQRIDPARSLFFTDNTFGKLKSAGLVLGPKLSAVWDRGTLFFESEAVVKRFLDLTQVFEEATDEDIDEFAKIAAIRADTAALKETSSSWYRRRITAVMRSGILDAVKPTAIIASAKKFGLTLKSEKVGNVTKILVPTERAELKEFLRFLNEDYFESSLREEMKYRSSSKIPITKS